ncbi:MAG: Hsp70 family protein [Planctomycetota bacterium]
MTYCIGIDLGTTNCVIAYAKLPDDQSTPDARAQRDVAVPMEILPIPQIVDVGQTEARTSLPSFVYLPRDNELDALSCGDGFPNAGQGVVGQFARSQAAENPQRVIVAAKSWLCHTKVGRTEAVLPWQSPAEVPKRSAVECTQQILEHLVAAWHQQFPDAPIQDQDVTLTVPASFDPAARDFTRQAALAAGLHEQFVLLEEPQAAVYQFLSSSQGDWRQSLTIGDRLLVIDVGGGTTDLTLLTLEENDGEVHLRRLAVGNHVLVGGDNMDLALAYQAAQKLKASGHDLDPWQSTSLWHACRAAKETLLRSDGPQRAPVAVLGRGSSLIGSTITTELAADEVTALLLDGFFPKCDLTDRPQRQSSSGFQDIGLPFESDPAISRQVAAFLHDHLHGDAVTHVLFNGGVFHCESIVRRMTETMESWYDRPIQTIGSQSDFDRAVACGAAVYSHAKRTGGMRIRGGTAKAYYIGIETAGLAIPGAPRPLRAVCVAPQGMEEGTQAAVPNEEVGVVVGTPAQFRFFQSTNRPNDDAGTRLDRWSELELQEIDPITASLDVQADSTPAGSFVPVRFESTVTELGMLELRCQSTQTDQSWKLEFNARESANVP